MAKLGFEVFASSLFPNIPPVHPNWQKPAGSQLENVFSICNLQTLSSNTSEHSII